MLPVIQVIELDETISPYKALSEVQGLLQLRSSLESRKQQSAESTHLAELMKGKRASLSIRIDQGKKWDARLINNSGLYGKCFYSSILSLSPRVSMMKVKHSFSILTAFLLFATSSCYAQQYQPDDVIHTIGRHQLKYRHVLAYINIEMEGEDTALMSDGKYIEELTQELLEEFAVAPEEVINDMDEHYAAMQMDAGFQMGTPGSDTGYQTQQNQDPVYNTGESGQWKQMLSGSVLYYSKTESYNGMFVQSTQYMHLCPNGTAYTYQSSAGGGDVSNVGISNPEEMEFTGSVNWGVTEQGGAAYFQIALAGTDQRAFPMRLVNNQIHIQGLGDFYRQAGAAACR